MIGGTSLNIAVSNGHNYKGRPCRNGRDGESVFLVKWTIVGTLTATLIFEGSDDDDLILARDVGNLEDQTDVGTWIKIAPIYDATDTIVSSASIAITNSTTDAIVLTDVGFRAVRPKLAITSGSGTANVTISSRRR